MFVKSFKYNIVFEHNGERFAFNSFTTALNKIDDEFIYILDNIKQMGNGMIARQNLVEEMIKEGYLVNDDFDELKMLRFYNMNKKFCGNTLTITISPTLSCNFACSYCFENSQCGTMTELEQDRVVEFIRKKLENKKFSNLSIIWFGGEPLCAKKIVYNISSKLIELCENMGIKYNAKMISNFYLADEETIVNLKKFKISQVQVTIDGSKENHNSRRVLKTGSDGTFDVIINNICKSKLLGLQVVIRINSDKTNIDSVDKLLDILVEKNLRDLYVYLAHTFCFSDSSSEIKNNCFLTKEFAAQNVKLIKLLLDKGFDFKKIVNSLYPKVIPFHCSAQSNNAFIIGPYGELYKCEHDVGNMDRTIGFVDKVKLNSENKYTQLVNESEWLLASPFNSNKCRECKILPICMGGCLSVKKTISEPHCMQWKYNLIDILKFKCDSYLKDKKI